MSESTADILLCWSQPIELHKKYDQIEKYDGNVRLTYSVNWCMHDIHSLKVYGCFTMYKITHKTKHPYYQTLLIRNVKFDSMIWFRVTSYSAEEQSGGSSDGTYLLQSKPGIWKYITLCGKSLTRTYLLKNTPGICDPSHYVISRVSYHVMEVLVIPGVSYHVMEVIPCVRYHEM